MLFIYFYGLCDYLDFWFFYKKRKEKEKVGR